MENLLIVIKQILSKYILCDSCLGRQFASLGYGISNSERGKSLKNALTMELHKEYLNGNENALQLIERIAKSGNELARNLLKKICNKNVDLHTCELCNNIMLKLDDYVKKIIEKLEKEKYEFDTFLIGSRIPLSILCKEEEIRAEFKLEYGESIKREINREIGKRLRQVIGKNYDPENPDLKILLVFNEEGLADVELEPSPLFIYGRYKKLARGIPQNKWIIKDEHGNYIRKYPDSIEEYIAIPILKMAEGVDYKFHGAGREDVDARMLGNGRPFVVEIRKPKKRKLDLKLLEKIINENAKGKVEVLCLSYGSRKLIRELKKLAEISIKTYRALVKVSRRITDEDLKKLENFFNNIVINQRTPRRVLHRRVDKVRKKKVYSIKARKVDDHHIELIIRCQGGLYVKELISGDEGRTRPSIAEVLNTEAVCEELDVINIEDITIKSFAEQFQ